MEKYGTVIDENLLAEHYILDQYWIEISNRVQDGRMRAEEAVNVMDLMILPIIQRNIDRLNKTKDFPEFDDVIQTTKSELDAERVALLHL
jgi:hypothetical protein